MAATAQQQAALAGLGMGVGSFNLGLGSLALTGMPNGLSVAQLAQLNGMNPFGVNMMGITAEAQLLATQIAAAGGGLGSQGLTLMLASEHLLGYRVAWVPGTIAAQGALVGDLQVQAAAKAPRVMARRRTRMTLTQSNKANFD
jgi:hypothetical protein